MKNSIEIVAQAFYGNRTATTISEESIDRFILGYMDETLPVMETIDRSVIRIPDTDNLVIIYNKHQEANRLIEKANLSLNEGYEIKALAMIPKNGIALFSRCIACRMKDDGTFENLRPEDYSIVEQYLVR